MVSLLYHSSWSHLLSFTLGIHGFSMFFQYLHKNLSFPSSFSKARGATGRLPGRTIACVRHVSWGLGLQDKLEFPKRGAVGGGAQVQVPRRASDPRRIAMAIFFHGIHPMEKWEMLTDFVCWMELVLVFGFKILFLGFSFWWSSEKPDPGWSGWFWDWADLTDFL